MRTKNLKVYLTILQLIHEGEYASTIARRTHKTPPGVHRYIKTLERWKCIRATGGYPKFYEVTPTGRLALIREDFNKITLGKRKAFKVPGRWHNLGIKMPILKDNPNAKLQRQIKLRGWTKELERYESASLDFTIERTTKNIIIWVPGMEGDTIEVMNHLANIAIIARDYLDKKYKIKVDLLGRKIIRQEVAHATDAPVKKSKTVLLHRRARAMSGQLMKAEAKAYIDFSEGAEIETNDVDFETKLLMMPEVVMAQVPIMRNFSRNLELHLTAIQELRDAISELKAHQDKPNCFVVGKATFQKLLD